ncbi:MAG: hypothetical protein IPL83_03825 [Bdellovibrionales bacterium]|nr:hypothetical protein [Bdellovibrionales bacterium]
MLLRLELLCITLISFLTLYLCIFFYHSQQQLGFILLAIGFLGSVVYLIRIIFEYFGLSQKGIPSIEASNAEANTVTVPSAPAPTPARMMLEIGPNKFHSLSGSLAKGTDFIDQHELIKSSLSAEFQVRPPTTVVQSDLQSLDLLIQSMGPQTHKTLIIANFAKSEKKDHLIAHLDDLRWVKTRLTCHEIYSNVDLIPHFGPIPLGLKLDDFKSFLCYLFVEYSKVVFYLNAEDSQCLRMKLKTQFNRVSEPSSPLVEPKVEQSWL